jgi:hypothetical protein
MSSRWHPAARRDTVSYGGSLVVSLLFLFELFPFQGDNLNMPQEDAHRCFKLCAALSALHFLRRVLEANFVHVHRTSGTRGEEIALLSVDFAGECAYYWILVSWALWALWARAAG